MAKKKVVRTSTEDSPKQAQVLRPSARTKKSKVSWKFPLEKSNFIYLGIGLGIIILGYILMSTGITEDAATVEGTWNNPMAITVAPLLLVIGYCVVIPIALLKLFRKSNKEQDA